jgi:drug/metabolite transporter (DMT)-like permease
VIIAVALGAQLTLPQLLGGLIVFAGVALSSLRSTPSTVDAGPMDASPRITSAKL